MRVSGGPQVRPPVTPQILVVFTGGTIGSRVESDAIDLSSTSTRQVLADYLRTHPAAAEFQSIEPITILSENAKPRDWDELVSAIRAAPLSELDGVIVTHGTDTLPYTAAALSFALADLTLPIILVASDRPLTDPDANGGANFSDAVSLIREGIGNGVFVPYVNPDGRHLVHRGARLLEATPLDHYFHSIAGSEEGEIVDGSFLPRQPHPRDEYQAVATSTEPAFRTFDSAVLFIYPHPGLVYSNVTLTGIDAVVHGLYHSGTATADPGPSEMSASVFARRCKEHRVPIFMAPWTSDDVPYASTHALLEADVIPVRDLAAHTTYVKVLYGLGCGLRGHDLATYVAGSNAAGERSTWSEG